MASDPRNVFLNVPFDDAYGPLFETLVFAVTACGYRTRCALEEDDSGDIRLDKLVKLIRESPRSIHDLSRIEVGESELPRFNMPFELGMALGAKRFGGRKYTGNKFRIMVGEPYKLPAYLSDLGGNDPEAHESKPHNVIKIVRDFLHTTPSGGLLPGPAALRRTFDAFTTALPDIAAGIEFKTNEIRGFANYRTFLSCVTEFLTAA